MPLLEDKILDALRPAIGRTLVSVSYCCLEHEATEDDIASPEFYLGGEICLRFEPECAVWITWDENAGWDQHFSISALTEKTFNEGVLQCYKANSLSLWQPVVGSPLNHFDILGWNGAPDVIRLIFGGGSVLIGTGYQGRFGDGDDVFARPDTPAYLDGKEKVLWSSA